MSKPIDKTRPSKKKIKFAGLAKLSRNFGVQSQNRMVDYEQSV